MKSSQFLISVVLVTIGLIIIALDSLQTVLFTVLPIVGAKVDDDIASRDGIVLKIIMIVYWIFIIKIISGFRKKRKTTLPD